MFHQSNFIPSRNIYLKIFEKSVDIHVRQVYNMHCRHVSYIAIRGGITDGKNEKDEKITGRGI